MTEPQVLARAYLTLMRGFVETGRALHYTELARELGLTSEEARQAQKDLVASGLPIWIHPGTDYILAQLGKAGPFWGTPHRQARKRPRRQRREFMGGGDGEAQK